MYSVPMALADFIPVLLFAAAAVLLQRDFYDRMKKGVFALFAAGTIDVIAAGFLKALYKLLYAMGVCDFQPLTQMFFPVQAIGFLLAGVAMTRAAAAPSIKEKLLAAAPPLFTGTFVFVAFMVLGLGAMDFSLVRLAAKQKKPLACVLFIVSFLFCLMMGYLSSRDFTQSYMNWAAELVNIVGQGSLLWGVLLYRKSAAGTAG